MENEINPNAAPNALQVEHGNFSTESRTQHDQIIVMKNEWQSICYMINDISLCTYNYKNIILGVMLTSAFNIICDYIAINFDFSKWISSDKYSIILLILSMVAYMSIDYFQENKIWKFNECKTTPENIITLKYIKKGIDNINSRQHQN